MDALPELVHHLQVLFPERVQHLQHDLLFELSHARANTLGFLVVSRLHRIDNASPQGLLVKGVVFIEPLCHRQI